MVLMEIAWQLPLAQAFCSTRKAKSDCETNYTFCYRSGDWGRRFFVCINYKIILLRTKKKEFRQNPVIIKYFSIHANEIPVPPLVKKNSRNLESKIAR